MAVNTGHWPMIEIMTFILQKLNVQSFVSICLSKQVRYSHQELCEMCEHCGIRSVKVI